MAAVLDSLTVTRFSALPIAASSSTISSHSSPLRSSIRLPEFNGLKIRPTLLTISSLGSVRPLARGGRIVCEAQDTAVGVLAVTDETWKSLVLESESPVLVEFWAPWCGPCRVIQPLIEELAKDYAGKLKCYKINTDESPKTATSYGIRSIPTVMIFKGGEKKDTVIGAVPKSNLSSSIEKFL